MCLVVLAGCAAQELLTMAARAFRPFEVLAGIEIPLCEVWDDAGCWVDMSIISCACINSIRVVLA
jgi:hypothetical protein